MLDKFHNSNSEHGLDLVAYIYGEMDETARARFESHLAGCDVCAVELGSYADARLGVIEWRRNDFEPLSTPAMIIPDSQPAATLVGGRPRRSWMAWIETVYALPGLARVGMGLAAAAILLGVFYFVFVPDNAPSSVENITGKTAAPAEQQKPVASPSSDQPDRVETAKKSEFEPGAVATSIHRTAVARSNAKAQTAALHQTPAIRNYRKIGPLEAVTPKTQPAPTLNTFEEEEDTTLRLSDLFSQVGPKKK
ncbi:MAG TPA: zf-HC2 domain-containing protein [Pyrinomonadaceae bacterium]|jgi:anti-sigma factor RsiW